jgi:hypothetical protein
MALCFPRGNWQKIEYLILGSGERGRGFVEGLTVVMVKDSVDRLRRMQDGRSQGRRRVLWTSWSRLQFKTRSFSIISVGYELNGERLFSCPGRPGQLNRTGEQPYTDGILEARPGPGAGAGPEKEWIPESCRRATAVPRRNCSGGWWTRPC